MTQDEEKELQILESVINQSVSKHSKQILEK